MAYSIIEQDLINRFRSMSAMTTQAEGSDSDYIQKQAMTDDEIYFCLENAVDDFNLFPPILTDFSIDSLIGVSNSYSRLLLMGAQIYALILLEFYEAGMYFQVSDDGHSITRNKFSQYSQMKTQLWGIYEKFLGVRKQHFGMSAMKISGVFSQTAVAPWAAYKGTRATRYSLYGTTSRNLR